MHPVIDEILATRNVANVSAHTFNRWQRVIRDEIVPQLEELNILKLSQETPARPRAVRA